MPNQFSSGVVGTVMFLLSDQSAFTTGVSIAGWCFRGEGRGQTPATAFNCVHSEPSV